MSDISPLSLLKTSDTQEPSQTSFRLDLAKIRRSRMARNVRNTARLLQEDCAADKKTRYRSWFITTTYRNDVDWQPRHMTQAIKCFRSWCNRRGVKCRYLWICEVQNRRKMRDGSHGVHYHLLIYLPLNIEPPRFDTAGWWSHGRAQTALARSPVAYMSKMAYNDDTSEFPRGCRLTGSGGLSVGSRLVRAWWLLPKYVRERFGAEDKPKRASGGGWVALASGEWIPPIFRVVSFNPLVISRLSPC
jgi:hypothetical protein